MGSLGCRTFDTDAYRELLAVAVSLAQGTPRAERLVQSVIDEARSRHILLPTPRGVAGEAAATLLTSFIPPAPTNWSSEAAHR